MPEYRDWEELYGNDVVLVRCECGHTLEVMTGFGPETCACGRAYSVYVGVWQEEE